MQLSVVANARITFGIAYQDEHLLVVEKPARVPTQPGKGHEDDTLLNALFSVHGAALQNLGKARDFGLLHRLDKDTSGLLVIALRASGYDKLRADFEQRRIKKFYWAICDRPSAALAEATSGKPKPLSGVIDLPLLEQERELEGQKMKLARISRGQGKPAVTAYRVLQQGDAAALVEARPLTGRLHQVRVHLEAVGMPVLGDRFYGPRRSRSAAPRLALHAHRLVFTHPITGETVDARSNFPDDLRGVLRALGLARPQPVAAAPPDGSPIES